MLGGVQSLFDFLVIRRGPAGGEPGESL